MTSERQKSHLLSSLGQTHSRSRSSMCSMNVLTISKRCVGCNLLKVPTLWIISFLHGWIQSYPSKISLLLSCIPVWKGYIGGLSCVHGLLTINSNSCSHTGLSLNVVAMFSAWPSDVNVGSVVLAVSLTLFFSVSGSGLGFASCISAFSPHSYILLSQQAL